MNAIIAIFKKEIKRIVTDRRLLVSLFLPGILIYVIYSLMGNIFQGQFKTGITEYYLYMDHCPEGYENIFNNGENATYHINEEEKTVEEKIAGVQNGTIDLYLIYSENFAEEIKSYDVSSGEQAPFVLTYYNSGKETSQNVYSLYTSAMNTFESKISNKFDLTIMDQASDKDIATSIMSSIMPMVLIIFLFTGAMSVTTESVAGEKERGTFATLLITPTKRSEIAIGKILALGLISLVSSAASFLGIISSFPKLVGAEISFDYYDASTFVLLFLVVIFTELLFTTLLTIISSFAKNAKEASSMAAPLMILFMGVSLLNMVGQSSESAAMYCIPVYNSVLCVKSILLESINPVNLGITIGINLIVSIIGCFVLTRMFNSEKVMFNT